MRYWALVTFLALGVSRSATALAIRNNDQTQPGSQSSLSPEMIEYVEGIRTRYSIPSIGIATVMRTNNSGEMGWESATGSFGTANVQGDPVTKHSLFSIASNTKLFTALSVGMLIENGTLLPDGTPLGWSTKLKCIYPDLKFPTGYQTELLDVLDLVSLRSGMPRHDIALGMQGYETVIKSMPLVKPSAELRQTWQYSNWHYILLSGMIPTLTGVPFQDYLQQHIFDPLNMTSTYLNAFTAEGTGRWVDGSMRIGMNLTACGEQIQTGALDDTCLGNVARFGKWTETDSLAMAGAGGIITSMEDMTKWISELLNPHVIPQSLIDKAAYPFMISAPPPLREYSAQVYGMGQISFSYRGHPVVTHTGGLPGQNSILLRVPEAGAGIFVATNEEMAATPLLTTIVSVFLDQLLGLEPIDWETRLFGQLAGAGSGDAPSVEAIPGPSQEQVVGQYEHPVYGTLDLQPVTPDSLRALVLGVEEGTYVAPVDKLFTNYVSFTHFSENVFNWTAAFVKNPLNPDRSINTTVAGVVQSGSGSAVINDQGIGMFGDFWGAGAKVPMVQAEIGMENVQERAEVWFEKKW